MKIFDSIDSIDISDDTIITIGMFDGVHAAHIQLLELLKKNSTIHGVKSLVITFQNHPQEYFSQHVFKLITPVAEKQRLFEVIGIDYLVCIPFDTRFSAMTAEAFLDWMQSRLGMTAIMIGYDHKFGKDRKGDFSFLKNKSEEQHFVVHQLGRKEFNAETISSSAIRKKLSAGDILGCNQLLGRNYAIDSYVVIGDQLGRTIGFSTANLFIDIHQLLPQNGVYVARVRVGEGWFKGLVNVGVRPTINGQEQRVEAHILDFDQDIYGAKIRIEFLFKIRDEQKFDGLEALKNQIQKDIDVGRKYFM